MRDVLAVSKTSHLLHLRDVFGSSMLPVATLSAAGGRAALCSAIDTAGRVEVLTPRRYRPTP